ncbi:MAG: hypothetical protein ACHQ4G_01710 [Opitutales bacterium]
MPRSPSISCLIFCVGVTLGAAGSLRADPGANSPELKVEGAPTVQGATFRFFDAKTGVVVGRLQIGHVDFEYRQQGFMHVAWRPLVVLAQVELDVGSGLAWPSQGSQIVRALHSVAGHDKLVVRELTIRLQAQASRKIHSTRAVLDPDDSLKLFDAQVSVDGVPAATKLAGTFRLPLTGPHAGMLEQLSATPVRGPPSTNYPSLSQLNP